MTRTAEIQYRQGLAHGWEDARKEIREILARDVSDARKLELIAERVAVEQ